MAETVITLLVSAVVSYGTSVIVTELTGNETLGMIAGMVAGGFTAQSLGNSMAPTAPKALASTTTPTANQAASFAGDGTISSSFAEGAANNSAQYTFSGIEPDALTHTAHNVATPSMAAASSPVVVQAPPVLNSTAINAGSGAIANTTSSGLLDGIKTAGTKVMDMVSTASKDMFTKDGIGTKILSNTIPAVLTSKGQLQMLDKQINYVDANDQKYNDSFINYQYIPKKQRNAQQNKNVLIDPKTGKPKTSYSAETGYIP